MKLKNERFRRVLQENQKLKEENRKLALMLEKSVARHQKWEQIAASFHDTLWEVLLKYDPDTYGEICPHNDKKQGHIDLDALPKLDFYQDTDPL